jgi:hypothetical protein
MGGMVMGECQDRQRMFCITQKNYKHFEGRYGKLPLGDVYTCHGFFQIMHEFEEANSKTFVHKLNTRFVDKRFGNYWQPIINKILETPTMTLCNYK